MIFLRSIAIASCLSAAAVHGLVNIPVACMREQPRHASQLISQAVLGTPLEVTDTIGEWLSVATPDGYSGYMTASSVEQRSLAQWQHHERSIVSDPAGCVLTDSIGGVVVRLPFNSIVEVESDGWCRLPDGRRGQPSGQLVGLDRWAASTFDASKVVSTAYEFLGAPYLWGGISASAMDCSGLVSLCYMSVGRVLRRDAWMQHVDGEPVDSLLQTGDLVFFDRSGNGRVDHVAIYDTDSLFIHCSGMVKVNSLTPEKGDTISGNVVGFARIRDGKGARPVKDHPLYFPVDK